MIRIMRRVPWGLALALGFALPGLALLHLEGAAGTPDGEWIGSWGATVRTVAQLEEASLRAGLGLIGALAIVVWLTGLLGHALGWMRGTAARRTEWAVRSAVGASPRRLRREVTREALRDLAWVVGPALGLAAGFGVFLPVDGVEILLAPSTGLVLLATAVAVIVSRFLTFPTATRLRRPINADALALRADVVGAMCALQVGCTLGLAACAVMVARAAPGETIRAAALLPHARDTVVLRARLPVDLPAEQRAATWKVVRERLEAMPGTRAATVTSPGGLLGLGPVDVGGARCFTCVGGNMAVPVTMARARHVAVDGRYFEVLGIDGAAPAGDGLAIDRGMRRAWFQDADPVGGRATVRGRTRIVEQRPVTAGIAGHVVPIGPGAGPPGDPDAAAGTVYLSLSSAAPRVVDIGVRLAGPDAEAGQGWLVPSVEAAIPGLRVEVLGTLASVVEAQVLPLRRLARLAGGLAAGAGLLGVGGIACAMAERIRLRRREIGLRRAVGAPSRAIVGLALADAARVTTIGGTLGLALAVAAGRGLPEVLPGIASVPPAMLALLAVVCVAASLAAAFGAVRDAAALDPIDALRG